MHSYMLVFISLVTSKNSESSLLCPIQRLGDLESSGTLLQTGESPEGPGLRMEVSVPVNA